VSRLPACQHGKPKPSKRPLSKGFYKSIFSIRAHSLAFLRKYFYLFVPMRIIKYKAYCVVELTDDLSKLPDIQETRNKAIEWNTSRYGHPCDDPRKRGAVCEVEIAVKVPTMPPVTDDLRDYIQRIRGVPALVVIGDENWNRKELRRSKTEQRRALLKLARVKK